MAYKRIVEKIPPEKREQVSTQLVDLLLKSKNEEKMPNDTAKTILHHWQHELLTTDSGLAALLEGAVQLELDKTIEVLEQKLQLKDVADAVRKL